MKKITLAKVGDVSIIDRTYAPEHWEDGEPNNAWTMADAMTELLALAGKAYAVAVKDGSIRKFLTDGFPIHAEVPPNLSSAGIDPDEANLYQLTDRARKKRTAEMFGASNSHTQIMARKTKDGVSVSFAFNPREYPARYMGYEYGALNEMQLVLAHIPKGKDTFPRSTWEGMSPEGLENLRAINAWIKRRFPIGKPVTLRIPLENLLPEEFTETDDGEPAYNLAYLRESSGFLTVSVINTSDNKTTTSLSWGYATQEQREKYAKLFDNGYATLVQTDDEILQEGSAQVINLTSERVNDLHITYGIEIDLNTEEFDYVTQGTNDLSDLGEHMSALVKNVSNGEDYAYAFCTPDLTSSAPPRVGVGQTMISPYNLLPMYIPTTNQWEQYRAQRSTAYITPDGEYIRNRSDFPYDPKNELYGQRNVLPYGVMGVDWTTNMMFYDEGKGLKTLDLSDFATTKPLHIARFARSQGIYTTGNAWGTAVNRIYRFMTSNEKHLSELSKTLLKVLNPNRSYQHNLEMVWDWHTDDIRAKALPDSTLKVHEAIRNDEEQPNDYNNLASIASDSPLPFGRMVASILTDFLELWHSNPTTLIEGSNYTVPNLLHMVGVASAWYESYESNAKRKAFDAQAVKSTNKRQPDEFSQLPDDFAPEAVPNIKDGVFMLPHQAKVAYSMQQNKEHTLLEVAAGGGKCLTGNTLVPTSEGMLTLRELFDASEGEGKERALDVGVLTKEGIKRTSGTYTTKGKTYKVRLSNGSRLEGLAEHRLWGMEDGKLKFIRLDELKVGTLLPKYTGMNMFGQSLDISDVVADVLANSSKKAVTCMEKAEVKLPTAMTVELAELLGWAVSEGCASVGYSIEQHHAGNRARIRELGECLFGKEAVAEKETSVVWRSVVVQRFLTALCGKGLSKHRFMPKAIRKAPKYIVSAFLRGLFEGDGTIYVFNKGTTEEPKFGGYCLEYTTISKTLAQELLVMLENYGISCSVSQSEQYQSQGGKARVFTLGINRSAFGLFQQEVGFLSKEKTKLLKKAVKYRNEVKGTNNDQVFGSENRLPFGNLVNDLFERLERALDGVVLYSAYDNRYGGVTQRPVKATLKHLHSLAKTQGAAHNQGGGTRYLNGYNNEGWTNTWTITRLNECYNYLPQTAKANLDGNFVQDLKALNDLCSYDWVTVAMVKKGDKVKQVYDLSVPGPHEYATQTIMSHNTLSIIMDILRKLKDGVIKNPVVYCPAHLLANYVQDANYATEGKLNVIPLNTETYNRLGPEYYEKVVKGKPKNTFFVIAYNFASLKSEAITAGTTVVPYYPNAQWLRSLGFDIAYLDESHYLKNDSSRTHAMREALIDVPRITLATGTFYPTRVSDIINQTFLWDSGLFGYPQTFENQYPTENGIFTETSRNYVNSVLTEAVCVARAKRKEWAAVLPDRTVAFHSVPLSKEARNVYEAILKATLDEIKKDPVIMKLLAKAEESDEEVDIGDALQRYLQRLEKAITCPYQDELWQEAWGQQSPKLKVVEKICRDHIKKGIKGKILIFCSYHSSVDAIYDNLSPDLKDMTIRYSAGKDAPKFRQQFEKDDSKLIMVGVENSMNTGINAQFASRLIRIDSIYSPGQLEQGESRVCRPNLKVKEFREHLYFDWVLAEKTYDATKTARLVSKILDVEKFNNMHDPKYKQLKDLPVLRLNFDVIAQSSDFEGELQEYLTEYLRLENGIKVADVQDYRRRNPDLTPIPVANAGLLKGSALMKHVPYIPLGGVPPVLDGDFKPLSGELQNRDPKELKGAFVHTEYGEGVLTRIGTGTSTVEIPGQGKISLNNQTIYMIDKRTTSTKSIQQELAQKLKLKRVDVGVDGDDALLDSTETVNEPSLVREEEVQEPEVDEAPIKEIKVKGTKREPSPVPQDDEEDMMVNLYPSFVNEFYALAADEFTDWEEATGNDLSEYGFQPTGPIMYLQLKRWKQAADLKELWKASGVLAPKSFYETLDFLADAMKTNKTRMVTYQHLQRSVKDLLSWNLSKKRKQPSDRIRPYFCIQDGAVYVIIDRNSSPAYAKIKGKVRVTGAKWHMEDGARWYISTKRTDLVKTVKQMIKDGVPIADLEWVKETISHMKTATRKE